MDRYKKIAAAPAGQDRLLVDVFLESQRTPPREIWLDLDATDDPLNGHREGRFFHGYYRCYISVRPSPSWRRRLDHQACSLGTP